MIHWYTVIPLVVLFVLTIVKVPALMTLAVSSVTAVVVSFFHHSYEASEVFSILFKWLCFNDRD